jgi:hypothetical protein
MQEMMATAGDPRRIFDQAARRLREDLRRCR